MNDFTNELFKLSEMREKGLISLEEFQAAKARLFSNSEPVANQNVVPPEVPEAATVVMSAVPPAPPSVPRAAVPSAASKEIPPGIAGWSWGAFLWNWIWAIFNNTWIGLLALIPGVNIIMIFVLGVKGREWAWKNKQWDSVEHFNRVQRKWSVWGIGLVLASLLLSGLLLAFSLFFLASEGSKFSGFSVPSTTDAIETPAEPVEQMNAELEPADTGTPAIAEDAVPAETVAQDAMTDETLDRNEAAEATPMQDQDVMAAEQDRKYQQELAKTRAEAAAAKAETAKAKKEALKAEKALVEQRRLQEEERLAQELAEQEQAECPYSRSQPLVCSSRQGQPAYCDWDFKACGMPRLLKKESKTSCDGKMRTDPENNQLIVVDGCRGKFIPEN